MFKSEFFLFFFLLFIPICYDEIKLRFIKINKLINMIKDKLIV